MVGAAVIVLMVDVFADPRPRVHTWIVTGGFATAAVLLFEQWERVVPGSASLSWNGSIISSYASIGFKAALLVVAVLGMVTAWRMVVDLGRRTAEGVSLILVATAGFMFMTSSVDLVMLFVALEIGSISLYVLAGIVRSSRAADEAAVKYFLLGAFASAIFIYGAALTYAGTGSTSLLAIGDFLSRYHVIRPGVILIGMTLLIVGMAFKVTAAPFHSWAPDVYQGAPSGVVGFMAASAKIGGFAALINILFLGFDQYGSAWRDGLTVLAVLSVVVGTLLAIQQTDARRMLAYSGVAHAGFILTGLSAGAEGLGGVVFYLATYSVILVAAFAAVTVVSGSSSGSPFDAYRGLGSRSPVVAAAITVLMLGLSGMPLTTGFIGKFQVFSAAWDAGRAWLVIVGLLASVAAFFFYLRLIVVMYFDTTEEVDVPEPIVPDRGVKWVLVASSVATVVFGIYPTPILDLVNNAFGG
jgi:NADH-quinone oxidoreductase subunit N